MNESQLDKVGNIRRFLNFFFFPFLSSFSPFYCIFRKKKTKKHFLFFYLQLFLLHQQILFFVGECALLNHCSLIFYRILYSFQLLRFHFFCSHLLLTWIHFIFSVFFPLFLLPLLLLLQFLYLLPYLLLLLLCPFSLSGDHLRFILCIAVF